MFVNAGYSAYGVTEDLTNLKLYFAFRHIDSSSCLFKDSKPWVVIVYVGTCSCIGESCFPGQVSSFVGIFIFF